MNKKFVIFDMDGTLVDSMRYWRGLTEEYFRHVGVEEVPTEVKERIKPMTLEESAAMFVREYGFKGTAKSIVQDMNAMMKIHYLNDITLKDGVKEYLQKLQESGVRMCVASATAEYLMEICLKHLGIRHYFEFILSCEQVGVGKQQPKDKWQEMLDISDEQVMNWYDMSH